MAKVVTFGEVMMRLSAPDYKKIVQTNSLDITFGGGEANVGVGLATFGHDAYHVTRFPNNSLGDAAVNFLRGVGVKTDFVERSGDRLGLYFLEVGVGLRPTKATFDRKNSAFTSINPSMFDFDAIFEGAEWFHCSGVVLALGEAARNTLMEALKAAKRHNVKVSFDFNFRASLWSGPEEARPYYREVVKYANVCFNSFYDFNSIVGVPTDITDIEERRKDVFAKAMQEFDIDYIFDRDRKVESATVNTLNSVIFSKDGSVQKVDEVTFGIYDRIGGGDAFSAGVIHVLLNDYSKAKEAGEFGLATSVLKHALPGDICVITEEEVARFLASGGKTNPIR